MDKSLRLKKELTLLHVCAIATGTTLSAGLFLLPGLAAQEAGSAIVLCYLLAAVPLIPAMFSVAELATAMPRAGGAYYFLDRALGPLAGTIGGLGTWLALMLKTAFALVGIGAYVVLFLPEDVHWPWLWKGIAAACALLFGFVNLAGARKTGRFQMVLVLMLLVILGGFIIRGGAAVDFSRFAGFFDAGSTSILSTAGLVYISYVGVTNVASVSEEVKNPDRNLPLGIFLALTIAVLIYLACTFIMVGVLEPEALNGHLTAIAEAANVVVGPWGMVLISIGALIAFLSVANAGILASSRYPLAMSRDHLVPPHFRRLNALRTPTLSIVVTVGVILAFLLFLDPVRIAKLASAFQLLMFAMLCLAVIVMRESRIESYDPGYRSPLYPWMQIFGIIAPLVLIAEMGLLPILFSSSLIVAGIAWYYWYARKRVVRHGAIYHVFERLGRRRFDELDRELRSILKEKGLREHDPFDEVVARAQVIDIEGGGDFEDIVRRASHLLAKRAPVPAETLIKGFLEGTRIGATPVTGGVALPHMRLRDVLSPRLVLVRCRQAVEIPIGDPFGESQTHAEACAIFFLISPDADPGQHLRLLAQLASRVDQEGFIAEWLDAEDEYRLREILLRSERHMTLTLARGTKTHPLVDHAISALDLPTGSLVAVILRGGEAIIPRGDTTLREGDQLTIIGHEKAISELYTRYTHQPESLGG